MSELIRHERYPFGDLPFVLSSEIERTPHNRSTAQNWHEEIEIQLCLDGCGEVLLGGKSYDVEPGDVIVINSNLLHHTGSRQRVVYSCLIPRIEFCRTVGLEPSALKFKEKIRDARLSDLIKELSRIYSEGASEHRHIELCEKLVALLSLLVREYSVRAKDDPATDAHLFHVRTAISFIHENYKRRFLLEEIARTLYTDKYTLCREFKRLTGQTVIEYANSYRIHNAASLISSGATVAEAARESGFDNLSFFTKTFKKYMYKTPSRYRRELEENRRKI